MKHITLRKWHLKELIEKGYTQVLGVENFNLELGTLDKLD